MRTLPFSADNSHQHPPGTGKPAGEREGRDQRWRGYLDRIATGDEAAMAALFEESRRISSWMSRRILHCPEDAEEVLTDAYAQLWRNAAHYDSAKGGVSSWIVLLVRSRALDLARRRSSRSRWEVELAPQHRERCRELSPEQAQVRRAQNRYVRAALAQLPRDERLLLELAYDEELTHADIALRLCLPLGTVKTRIRRGLSRMRKLLGVTAQPGCVTDPVKSRAA
jgi:RNA polymerase sigma-70 factor (ECF subfamily)